MDFKIKLIFIFLTITALAFGFIHIYFPSSQFNYERLHIFFFNLCTGGSILLYYAEGIQRMSKKVKLFLTGSLIYAVLTFFEIYSMALIINFILFLLVEKIRIKRFSFFPLIFFELKRDVSEKFLLSALLCLSIGLFLAGMVILNNQYLHWICMEKLTLNTFFLGFSFPLSLISLHLVFSMLIRIKSTAINRIMESCFWLITLGVIIFFALILSEKLILEVFVTMTLLITVITVFILYYKYGRAVQQKFFLASGIGFLIITAVTGILYIFMEMSHGYNPEKSKWLLHLHVFTSLYGWNFCGLFVICRLNNFPIQMHAPTIISLHWITVLILAPLGVFYGWIAILTIILYLFITFTLFFAGAKQTNEPKLNQYDKFRKATS